MTCKKKIDVNRMAKRMFESRPIGVRKVGRPVRDKSIVYEKFRKRGLFIKFRRRGGYI